MPVDTPHKDYHYLAPLWQICRDVDAGEPVVKGKGREYLPSLTGMDEEDYRSYLMNARLYNALARTIQGFVGSAFRVAPHTEVLNPQMKEWLRDIDLAGLSLDGFLKKETQDKFKTGRYGIRVDMRDEVGRPYFAPYTAENIINWREEVVNGRKVIVQLVLRESEVMPKLDDEFEVEETEIYHVLDLVDGACRLRLFRYDEKQRVWMMETPEPPNKQGVLLDFIPFIFDGISDTTPDCEKPPLLDLALVNLGHYRSTADYYDAQRFSSKPQGWVTGAGQQDQLRIGSRVVWMLPIGATTGYLEYTGAGIGAIRTSLIDDETRMARLGAAVIEEPKEGVESAETSRINQSGKTSVLSSLTQTTGLAASAALRMAAWWGGMTDVWDDPRITCTLNQDFVEAKLSATDLLNLVQSWQARGISRDTLTYNIKRGGLLPEGRTIEDEIAKIDSEAPLMPEVEEDNLDEDQEEKPPPNEPEANTQEEAA